MKQLSLIIFLVSALFAGMPKFLMPDEAFIPHAKLNSAMQIEVNIELAKSIYLYEDKVDFELKNSDGLTIANVKKPVSVEHDEFKVYLESPAFLVSLKNDGASGVKEIEFVLSYQGCSEQGLCYEPLKKSFKFSVDTSKISSTDSTHKELSQTDAIVKTISSGNIFMILLTFLGFGLLLSLTPCVFPMIPIISGLIISQGENITTKRAFFLSVVYVLAMAVAYTIAGVLAGLFGANLQAALQNPFVIYSFSGIFVLLALSMFGFYELKLPDSLVNRVSSSNSKGGVVGVAIMGFLSALIVGPCVAAPLAGALVYIGQTGDALLGGMALFSMSIGMGLPLIAVGVSAGKFMPKPGAWMTMVTATFGIIMLGVAIWMLEKVVSLDVVMILYAVLGLGSAIYFGVFQKDGHMFKKSFALVLLIYSFSLFIGVLGGSTNMLKPLKVFTSHGVISQPNSGDEKLKFQTITTFAQLDKILKNNIGKKIILDFSAEWCTACKEYVSITFADEKVKKEMRKFVLVRVDVTDNTPEEKAISKKYGVFGPPDIVFIDEEGTFLNSKTIVGYMEPVEFLKHLKEI